MKTSLPVFLLLISFRLLAQNFNPAVASLLQERLDSVRKAQNIQGVSAAVYFPGQGLWQGVSGLSHPGVPIDQDMLFAIGSNTKLFTAVSILKLAELGKLRLEDSVGTWFPNHPNIDPRISIRQLLHHSSGLRNYSSYPGYADSILADPNRVYRPAELLKWIGLPLFDAGTDWNYSNTNYLLAGIIAERVSGLPLDSFMRQYLITPLGLDHTFFWNETLGFPLAHPWEAGRDNGGLPRTAIHTAAWAAGGMYANAGDMALWYRGLFDRKIVGQALLNEMTAFEGPEDYGLGIQLFRPFNRPVWGHSGLIKGSFQSLFYYDPAGRFSIAVLINENGPFTQPVANTLLRTLLQNLTLLTKVENTNQNKSPSIHPNPSHDYFRVNMHEKELMEAVLLDLQGREMLRSKDPILDVRNLPAGCYLVKLTDRHGNQQNLKAWKK